MVERLVADVTGQKKINNGIYILKPADMTRKARLESRYME